MVVKLIPILMPFLLMSCGDNHRIKMATFEVEGMDVRNGFL